MKFLVLVSSLLVSGFVVAAPPADPKFVDAWSRADEFTAARGVRKAAAPRELKQASAPELERLLDAFLDAHPNTGLLVLKGDRVLAERYQYGRTAGHRFASASVAKTVLGMLVGIAVSEGHINTVNDRADQYVPALKGHPYGEATLRELLTMSSGIAFTETYKEGDDISRLGRNTLGRRTEGGVHAVLEFNKREAPPGRRFRYASADSQVLGLVLMAAVKQPLATYLSEKIWQPMGAEANATWLLDKGGYEAAFCCLNATLRDYARFGLLLARYGELDGKQIIPAEWVKAAITPQKPHLQVGVATPNNGYGYQTWITHRTEPRFAALGIHGQAIYVDPKSQIVVVHTAAWADPTDRAERGAQFKLLAAIYSTLESQ